MGACEFIITAQGATAHRAYHAAVQDALEEYGHQHGYSGTISSTDGQVWVAHAALPLDEAVHKAEELLDADQASNRPRYSKAGTTGAIRCSDTGPPTDKRTTFVLFGIAAC